ncbi:hypothetical protein DUNSADRAFT_13477, partial [Dunaliella salina]
MHQRLYTISNCLNAGNLTWSVPSDIPSGRYLIKVISASDENNQAVIQDPLRIQAEMEYSILAVPAFPSSNASIGSFTSLSVLMMGTLGNASGVLEMDEVSIDKGNGVRAWSVFALDIGKFRYMKYHPVNGSAGLGALVVHDGSQFHQ